MTRTRLIPSASQMIWGVALAAIAILVGSFAHDHRRAYQEELAEAELSVRSGALVLAEHTARTLESAEKALQAVARIRQDAADRGYDAPQIHNLLQAVHGGSPIFRGIGWTDAAGNRLASSAFVAPPPLSLAESDHFTAQRDATGASGLYVAAPVRSDWLEAWVMPASLRLAAADGSFAGIAAGMLDPAYLARVYGSIALGQGTVVTLFRDDGTILARSPFDTALAGQSLSGRRFITRIVPQAPVGSFRGLGLGDGADRIVGYAVLPESGFILTVAIPRAAALAGFRNELAEGGVRLVLAVAILCVGAWLLVRQLRRREELSADLRRSEARARDFAASSADWYWETDAEYRLIWISGAAAGAAGLPPARMYGRTPWDIAAEGGAVPADWAEHRRVLEAQQPFRDFGHGLSGADGLRWLRTSGLPIFDEAGRFRGYRGTTRDVTDLVRAQERLREAVEAIPGGFLLFDGEGKLAYSSANTARYVPEMAAADRLGDSFPQILARSLAMGHLRDAKGDPDAWLAWRLRQHREVGGSTLVRIGGRIVEVIERPLSDGGVMVLRFDVTEREQGRAALQQAREAADAASRAKTDFLASMSHELRTPLNAIIGFGELLGMDRPGTLTPQQSEYAGIVVKSGHHLLTLVDEVLDLAAIEAGRLPLTPGAVEIGPLLCEAVRTVEPAAMKAGIALQPLGDLPPVRLRADPQRLRQVLINLLSNAVKYNRPGGSVSVAASAAGGDRVRLSVSDTGPGIAAADVAQLFRPFQRLGAEFTAIEGTGIGLALCKKLATAMDGRIGCDSWPGHGSTFWIELPVAAAPGAAAPAAARAGRQAPPAPEHSLLHVDDNPISLALMRDVLAARPGVRLLTAATGPDGLEIARRHRPDMIVLDLNLPGMSGVEVLERLRRRPETAGIPVIALTAAAMPAEVQQGLQAGFFRYLTKPLDVQALYAAIDAALATEAPRRAAAG